MQPFPRQPVVRPNDDRDPLYIPIAPQPRREATADEYASNRRMLRAIQAGGNPQGILDLFRDALESDYDEALPQALDFLDTLEPARPDLRDRLNQTILATARPQDEPRKAPPAQPAEPLEQQAEASSQVKRRHAVHEALRPDFSGGGGGGGRLNLETIKRRMMGQVEQQATQPPPNQTTPPLPAIPPQEPSVPEEHAKPTTPPASTETLPPLPGYPDQTGTLPDDPWMENRRGGPQTQADNDAVRDIFDVEAKKRGLIVDHSHGAHDVKDGRPKKERHINADKTTRSGWTDLTYNGKAKDGSDWLIDIQTVDMNKNGTPTARERRAAEKIAAHHVVEVKDNKGVRYLVLIEKSKGMSEAEWREKAHKKAGEALDYILK